MRQFKIVCLCGSEDVEIFDKEFHCRKCGAVEDICYLIGTEGSMTD